MRVGGCLDGQRHLDFFFLFSARTFAALLVRSLLLSVLVCLHIFNSFELFEIFFEKNSIESEKYAYSRYGRQRNAPTLAIGGADTAEKVPSKI